MIHPIFPVVTDIDDLESGLCDLLQSREQAGVSQSESADTVYGKKLSWISLIFAVFAAGCQNSEIPRKERELASRVLGKRFVLRTNLH
jgi:hypothetical protein